MIPCLQAVVANAHRLCSSWLATKPDTVVFDTAFKESMIIMMMLMAT